MYSLLCSYRTFRLRPGEVESQPIEKALPSHILKSASSSGDESEKGLSRLSQDKNTDGETSDHADEGLLSAISISVQDAASVTDLQVIFMCNDDDKADDHHDDNDDNDNDGVNDDYDDDDNKGDYDDNGDDYDNDDDDNDDDDDDD